jgi:hypothetical protein
MSAKTPVGDNDKATAVVADAAVVADDWKETLKRTSGVRVFCLRPTNLDT